MDSANAATIDGARARVVILAWPIGAEDEDHVDGADADNLPACVQFAEGSAVRKHLSAGRRLIMEDGDDVPLYVRAFRRIFCPSLVSHSPYPVEVDRNRDHALWRTMFSSHAQLWYRLAVLHSMVSPHRGAFAGFGRYIAAMQNAGLP